MNENMTSVSKADSPPSQSLNDRGDNDNNNDATNKANLEERTEKVQDNIECGPEQQDLSSSPESNKGSDKETLQKTPQSKEDTTSAESSHDKNASTSLPHVGTNSAQERKSGAGSDIAMAVGTPSQMLHGGMAYPSPSSYPIESGGPRYSNMGETPMRSSPMGPMGSGPDNQQWRYYNPRDHPSVSAAGVVYSGPSHHGLQSPYHRNHPRHRLPAMGSPPGYPSLGRGNMYGGYSPDYHSPSRYYETIHNMTNGVMGIPHGHGGPYGMYHTTMSSPSRCYPMYEHAIYRSGGGGDGGRMSSPSGVDMPPNYSSSPQDMTTSERKKRPFEQVSPGIHASGENVASVKNEEHSEREMIRVRSGTVEGVRDDEENVDNNEMKAHSTFMETPYKDGKRQRADESTDVKTPSTETGCSPLESNDSRMETQSNHQNSSSKGEPTSSFSKDKAELPPGSLSHQQDPKAGLQSSPDSDPHSMKSQAREEALYAEQGAMKAGAEAVFPSPEGFDAPYRRYGRGRFEGTPSAGYYDEPPPPQPHGGYSPYRPPPPQLLPGYGPPPPSLGYYSDGINDYYQVPEYDEAMYYHRMMYGGPTPHGAPGGGYMYDDPRSAPPPPALLRSHPHTPYGGHYAPSESPQKPYVTPDSRTYPFMGNSSGQGSIPHGMGLPPETKFPKTQPMEEGEYTKLVRSKSVRLTDRKKLQNKAWYDRFEDLKQYKEEHGDCMVPQKYPQNPSLGTWVNKQRMEYKLLLDGHKSSMTEERLQALASIGFTWAKRKGQVTWDIKFAQLKEYKALHGDCLIPTKYSKDLALGRWVSTQREQYRLMINGDPRTKMTQERAKKLEEVGFVWKLQY